MAPNPMDVAVALIPLTLLVGMLVLAALWMIRVGRIKELKHRQAIAMIEKGMAPPPELAPLDTRHAVLVAPQRQLAADRFLSLGIIVVGLGAGVALIVGVAASHARAGLGIGGAVTALGLALIVNGVLARARAASEAASPPAMAPPAVTLPSVSMAPPPEDLPS